MITNDRQYRITRAQYRKLKDAVEAFDIKEAAQRTGSAVLAKAEFSALESEVLSLSDQIREYEALESGAITVLSAASLEQMPTVLIQARIAKGLSQRELAEMLGVKEQQVQRYEAEYYSSASLQRITQVARTLNLNISEVAEIVGTPTRAYKGDPKELDWSLFPVKEMYRRNWFEDFKGSLSTAMSCADELVKDFIEKAMPLRQPALLRQRARMGRNMDTYALIAWQCRILLLSGMEKDVGDFERKGLSVRWFRELAQMSQQTNGPQLAKEYLAKSGISLVFEPHLPRTYLDGATFLLRDGHPVIGMTLRYDRLDNFWFVLFHELAHVVKHLRKGKIEDIFDDLDIEGDDVEREANDFAGNMLIPDDMWETALARYVRTEEAIREAAIKLKIGTAIIAGRIRKEANNYVILKDMVGLGEVRKQFTEVRFGQ